MSTHNINQRNLRLSEFSPLLLLLFLLVPELSHADTLTNYQLYRHKKLVVAGNAQGVTTKLDRLVLQPGDTLNFHHHYCTHHLNVVNHLVIRSKNGEQVNDFKDGGTRSPVVRVPAGELIAWLKKNNQTEATFEFRFYESVRNKPPSHVVDAEGHDFFNEPESSDPAKPDTYPPGELLFKLTVALQ